MLSIPETYRAIDCFGAEITTTCLESVIDCLSQSVGWQLGSHGDGTSNSIMETKMEARLAGAGKQYKMFSVSKTQSSPNYRKLRVIDQSKRFSRCPNPNPLSYSDSYRKLRAIMRTWGS